MSSEPLPRPIVLCVSNQRAYVWDVEDIATLRSQHRICGTLTGTLPHLAQQNMFLGVPLVLMPEETVLLVEKHLAVLVDDLSSHRPATPAHLQAYESARLESAKQQIAEAEAKEAADATRSMSDAALWKRKQREEKRKMAAALKTQVHRPDAEALLIPEARDDHNTGKIQAEKHCGVSASLLNDKHAYMIVTPASSASFGWYDTTGGVYSTIAAAKTAGIWSYPASLQERARCGVFKALWDQGFYMGGGIKFGGDYLVYPGDPLRYHSHFTATVVDSPTSALLPMEIVARGRLGTATKKVHLLCTWDDGKEQVTYLSIEWAGFG